MRYALTTCIVCLFIFSGTASGFGYFDSVNMGTSVPGLSPASAALGSARAIGISEPSCLFTNPSQITVLPFTLQASSALVSWKERVIESDLIQKVRTLNKYDYFTGAVSFPAFGLSFGAGYAKVAEFGYQGAHTVLSGQVYEPELGVAVLYAEGGQYEAMAGVSGFLYQSLAGGISAGVRAASADYQYYFNSHVEEIPDSSSAWSLSSSEFAWHAGLSAGEGIFKSGLSYSSKTEHMEDVLAIGVSAFAAHLRDITVGFEAELTSPFDRNRFQGKLSVIMPLRNNLNALTAVTFDDQRVANRAGLGFGLGFAWELSDLQLDCGLYSRFRSRRDTAFPDETSDRVDDGAALFRMGVTYNFAD